MDSSNRELIVPPSLRPLDPKATSRKRRLYALPLLSLGFTTILFGSFAPAFGQWSFIAGSIFILGGLFLLGMFMRLSHHEKSDDIHKLYRQQ
jgi:fatty acid desaturase